MYLFSVEKENRKGEGLLNVQHVSSNSGSSGSLPKRYQSVFTEGTPLTSFGLKNDDHYTRSHSPPNHIQPQIHQRPLKPVKEFLSANSNIDQQLDDRRRSSSQTNGFTRSQTEATVQSVNVALTKTLNKLRPEPLNSGSTTNTRSSSIYAGTSSTRPMTARVTTHHNTGTTTATATATSSSNYYYQLSANTKGPLPAELLTRRSTSSFATNILPNSTTHNRVSTGTGPLILHQSTTIKNEIKSNDNTNNRISTPLRVPSKTVDIGLHQLDGFNFDNVTLDEHNDKSKIGKYEKNHQTITKITSHKQSSAPRPPTADSQHRTLTEVSVNPQIQSSLQQNPDQLPYLHEPIQNVEKYSNHHHIQVEPTNTTKRISSSIKAQQIIDVQPTIIVQHQRPTSSTSRPNSAANIILPSTTKDPLNEAYIERDKLTVENVKNNNNNNNNDSTSTLKQYENQQEKIRNLPNSSTPPPSPSNKESNHLWRKQRNKYSIKTNATTLINRKNTKTIRPPARLKNYDSDSDSDSETTATETQSKEDDIARRHTVLPSDLGSDAWSDLTSEFSDTKLRKHPNIRTSTPNITRYSSSLSSKEVGQIRKQLTDLQIMYNDLLKLLDIDIESVRSSIKSSTSSQAERSGRKHRFRKVMPIMSMHHSNNDMKEINQRFTRVESSIVTLAESIAKLSAQIQMQRVIKDDVYNLRQEVAELRQQVYHQYPRQQCSTPAGGRTSSMSTTSQQQSRLITANVQRLAAVNSTNPLNISTSYMPSTSTILRSNSIIDPRQARKIEQFFGAEAMLRYFLSLLNYEEYVSVLEQEKIGFYELPYISERKLQSLGIPYGPCARIIYEAQQYFISLLTLKSNGIDV
ncbi:unnamed protein product [Rotaria sp. Silwood2]|nr:unnamed protein product [Rotaria sp. Silwood2]